MRKAGWLALALLALPLVASAETFNNVSVVDVNCSKKVADTADTHTRECALKCAEGGFGIVTSDKKFLSSTLKDQSKSDTALERGTTKDSLRVDVTGDVDGDAIQNRPLIKLVE